MTKLEMSEVILCAKIKKKKTWTEIAAAVGLSEVFTTSACLGQNSMSAAEAKKLCQFLKLSKEVEFVLTEFPVKGQTEEAMKDPLIYRFLEMIYVYGPTFKTLIQEKFGDGIMSAIDYTAYIEKVEDPKGDRVKITMCGKFLPYKHW
jgi:cyanate lyase